MERVEDPRQLQRQCIKARQAGQSIGFVPTMGFLHEGHLALIRKARASCDGVVTSIFVNPTQFGPNEDFSQYPRDLDRDLTLCADAGTDWVFTPEPQAMYPAGLQTHVAVSKLTEAMCGALRPGHFDGVCTVVAKLFNLVGPCTAFFGEKDYQQLRVIEQMAADLNFPVQVVGCPTVREEDGLAVSSRNIYLNEEERRQAACLYRALCAVKAETQKASSPVTTEQIKKRVHDVVGQCPAVRLQYIEVRDARTLDPLELVLETQAVVALAAFVGKTRLIDNMVLP